MKLYFYFLEEDHIRQEECEVLEKPKTYYPVDGFPKGFVGCFVKKEDIGRPVYYFINEYCIILLEKDNEKVAEMFDELCKQKIESLTDEIRYASENITKQESLIKMIDQWKNN